MKNEIKNNNTTQEWIANKIGVPYGTFRKWLSKKTYPDVHEGVLMARLLNTSVEELVDGDEGKRYILNLILREGNLYTPPGRIADLVEGLKSLDSDQLEIVRGTLNGLILSLKNNENIQKPGAVG